MSNRLLEALAKSTRSRAFVCPRTALELEVRLPSRAACADARAAAAEAWGAREVKTAVDLEEYQSYQREQLLARSVFVAGDPAPVGLDTVHALDEPTLRRYDAELRALEDEADPPLESWTEAEVAALVEAVKKKDSGIEVRLRTFGETRLIGLVLCMGALLSSYETSSSSTSTSGTATDTAS